MSEQPDGKQSPDAAPGDGADSEVTVLRRTLAEAEKRLKELETTAKDSSATLESRAREIEGRDKELVNLRSGLSDTVGKYRRLLLGGSPEVPEEMVKGDTAEEVDASFQKARQVVERVRQGLEARREKDRVPAGAPQRAPVDVSAMSPQEKIAYGLTARDAGSGR